MDHLPKTDERVYAETAAFAADTAHHAASGKYAIARALTGDITKTAEQLAAGQTILIPETRFGRPNQVHAVGPEMLAAFLHGMDPETQADIDYLADRLTVFNRDFAGYRAEFDAMAEQGTAHPDFLAARFGRQDFGFTAGGQDMIVRRGSIGFAAVTGFRAAEPIAHVSHLLAADCDGGMAVVGRLPGQPVIELSFADKLAIPADHLSGLVDTVLQMDDAGLMVSQSGTSYMYDSARGFGIVNFSRDTRDRADWSAAEQVMWTKSALIDRSNTPADADSSPDWRSARLVEDSQLLDRFVDVLETDHPEVLKDARRLQEQWSHDARRGHSVMLDIGRHAPPNPVIDDFQHRLAGLGLVGRTALGNHRH